MKGIGFLVDLFYVFFSVLFLIFFIIFPHWFLRDSVGRILPTPALYKMEKLLSGSKISANMLGSDVGKMRRSDPGLGFCRARNLVQQEKMDKKKVPLGFPFCRECRVRSDPCLGFCRAPPPHFFKKYLQNPSPQGDHLNWREDRLTQ